MRPILNIVLNGLRMLVAAVSGFACSVIIARTLGAQEMGIYSFALWVAGLVASLSSLGLPDAISKYVAQHKGSGETALAAWIARKIVRTQLIAAAISTLIAMTIWGSLEPRQILIIVLALATVLPSALQLTLFALLEGEQRFDLQVASNLGGSVFQVGAVGIVAWRWPSMTGFLSANLVAAIVLLIVTYQFSRSMTSLSVKSWKPERPAGFVRKVFGFSLTVYGLWLLQMVVFDKSEMLFLRILSTPEQLAFYSIAFALTARLATAGDSISYVLFPMFVTRFAETGEEGLRVSYRRSITYLQILMVPMCLWGLPLLPRIIVFAYGAQYAQVISVIRILLVTMLFSVSVSVNSNVLYALDKQMMLLRFMVPVAALNVILDLILIPRFAATGAAIANGASQATAALGSIMIIRKLLPGSFPARMSIKVYAAGIASASPVVGAEIFLQHTGPIAITLSVVLATLIYTFVLVSTRALSVEEVSLLKGGFSVSRLKAAKG